ncbi:hypothetical protein [Streptomyces liliiviolaceus]|nr:hypothetical protein [Streptomyces liliiviolaceus]
MTTAATPTGSQGPDELWEDEIPSTDNSFLCIGPAIPITRSQEDD